MLSVYAGKLTLTSSLLTMHLRSTGMTERKQPFLQNKVTGNGSVFLLDCNVAPFFVHQIASLLVGMTWQELLAFFNDVLDFSNTFAIKHRNSLDHILTSIEDTGLKVKPEKCNLLPARVSFVGHVLSSQGVSTDPEKVAAAKLWPPPTNMSELCTFLGNIGYYRKFILDFVTLTGPLFHLEQKGNNFFVVQRLPRIIRHPKESTL